MVKLIGKSKKTNGRILNVNGKVVRFNLQRMVHLEIIETKEEEYLLLICVLQRNQVAFEVQIEPQKEPLNELQKSPSK